MGPVQKQSSRAALLRRSSESMQQIYRRTPMPKCDFKYEITIRQGCSPENLQHISRTPCGKNNERLLLPGVVLHLSLLFKLKCQPHKMFKYTQTICRQQPTNCLSMFDHFVGLVLKGLLVSSGRFYFLLESKKFKKKGNVENN